VTSARRLHHSYQDYVAALEMSNVKLEYCDGEIYAMAGGTPAHAELAASITRILGNAMRGRCAVFSSDLKVRIESTDLSTFPDVTVVRGDRKLAAIDRNAVTNPTVVIEVTSNSTEDYDRGEKLSHYQQCGSINAVVFVSHRRPRITVVSRAAEGWSVCEYRSGQRVDIGGLAAFDVDELYAGIDLDCA
jgi:Uma2 family endonuclease